MSYEATTGAAPAYPDLAGKVAVVTAGRSRRRCRDLSPDGVQYTAQSMCAGTKPSIPAQRRLRGVSAEYERRFL